MRAGKNGQVSDVERPAFRKGGPTHYASGRME